MVTYLGSLVQLCCGEGGTLQTDISGVCGECSQCMDHTGFAPARGSVCFLGLHCSDPRLLCRVLSNAGPAFHALPRCQLLRFRFSGTPQGTTTLLCVECWLCLSQCMQHMAILAPEVPWGFLPSVANGACLWESRRPGSWVWERWVPGGALSPGLSCSD